MSTALSTVPLPDEGVSDLSDWKLECQEAIYQILELWISESKETLLVIQSFRDSISEATVYGSYTDQARAMSILMDILKLGLESVMRIVGQFDSPSHISSTLNEGSRRGAHKPYDSALDKLDPVQREQLVTALRGMVTEAKMLVEARTALPPATTVGPL